MNQKGTREQNDISIIRNLPRRLQQKIVEVVGDDYSLVDTIDATSTSSSTSRRAISSNSNNKGKIHGAGTSASTLVAAESTANQPRIDFFLQMARNVNSTAAEPSSSGTATVSEASGEVTAMSRHTTSPPTIDGYSAFKTATPVIPGILRVSVVDAPKTTATSTQMLIAPSFNGGAGGEEGVHTALPRENGKRCARQRVSERYEQLRREEQQQPQQQQHPNSPIRLQTAQPTWFGSVAEAAYAKQLPSAYGTVTKLLQRQQVFEKWHEFEEARAQLKQIFKQLLLHNLKLCCEQKIDTFFWKLLFYNVREYLKQHQSSSAKQAPVHTTTLALLDQGLQYYTELHAQLAAKFLSSENKAGHKYEFIAKVAAQKLLICLGDLSRYKAKECDSHDYAEATKYYQQAQVLIPTNGIPYNQLAIVAIHSRKKFDAIYFHMRSLMSSNAICSARESLLVLFDEIRKKYEETELKTSPAHNSPKLHNNHQSKCMRTEIWIQPDGARRLHRTNGSGINDNKPTMSEEKRYDEMSTEDLSRCFTSLYLYVIGKLYTGVGMESILENQRKLFIQLGVLLKRKTLPFTRSRMLKTVALNIFIIEHNMHKDSRRYYALMFCNQLFGLYMQKCNNILTISTRETINSDTQIYTEFNTLLQFIKIYLDWLTKNVNIWEPVRNAEHTFIDCWSEWQSLYTNLKRLFNAEQNMNLANVMLLEEDQFLLGFSPLSQTGQAKSSSTISLTKSVEIAQFEVRIQKILSFWPCYEANQKRLMPIEESHFTLEELNSAIKDALDNFQSDEDDNSENIVINGTHTTDKQQKDETKLLKVVSVEDAQITQLSKLKKELEAKTNVKKMYNAKLEEILKFVDTKVYIEVRPRYLLPDTNCFIDCLEDFEQLIKEFKRYTLVIPLTVVKELDGLSKGVKLESYEKCLQKHRIHHFDDVTTRAKKSLDFINTAKNNVKCATTKGSIINASLFALVEEEHVSNDDKILATALTLSKTMSNETCKDGKCFIQTELVLITTDRNLRVKALSRNLAVSELSEFLQWAKDCNT